MGIVLIVVLLLLLLGSWPRGPEPAGYYGYGAPGLLGVLLIVLLVVILMGHVPWVW